MSEECLEYIKERLDEVQSELATVKTDVAWIKRIIYIGVAFICSILGIDATHLLA